MVITNEEFAARIAVAKVGDRILLCSLSGHNMQHTQGWYGHPRGIVLRQGRFVLLNEEDWGPQMKNTPLSEEPTDRCCFASPDGVVVMSSDGTLRIDGDRVVSESEAHRPFQVPSSITRRDGKIFLAADKSNNGIEITEGEWDGWDLHPYGVMFRWKNEVTLVVTAPPTQS